MNLTLQKTFQNYPILSADEELELAKDYKLNNNLEAAHKLVLSHLRLVQKIARRYRGYNLPHDDLFSEGVIGLMVAVKNFDYTKGVRLMSYAVYSIKEKIAQYVVNNYRLVKIAATKAQLKMFWNREILNSDIEELEKCKLLEVKPKELQDFTTRLRGGETIIDDEIIQIACSKPLPDEVLEANAESKRMEMLKQAVASLPERERYIIRSRHLSENPKTYRELGEILGVSGSRVEQIERQALKKLKNMLCSFEGSV